MRVGAASVVDEKGSGGLKLTRFRVEEVERPVDKKVWRRNYNGWKRSQDARKRKKLNN